jgi:plasmid maintenance system antidote protein VapI
MYRFIKEKKKELLDGRTIGYIAKQCGLNYVTLTNILNGRTTTKKGTAYIITKIYNAEKEIADYFTRED